MHDTKIKTMNTKEFHISTGKELLAIKDRVRLLISHWGEDGRYKETILKSVIQRFLPAKYIIATGFVVKQTDDKQTHISSKQIDLIVYDSSYPTLFKEGDFVIVTPDSVKAIIEVKANMINQGFAKVVQKANEMGQFIFDGKSDINAPFFNGIFSYEGFEELNSIVKVKRGIETADTDYISKTNFSKFKVNHISFNKDLFFKYWEQKLPNEQNWVYKISDLSFSFFISNLMDYLSKQSVVENSHLWFSVDKDFEAFGKF